ncbi:transcriptional regulator [Shigella flexneri]|nr:transcriptional regulator [Shigella flexneri]EAA4727519.1 transcriptional regulator [Shigella flexneri]
MERRCFFIINDAIIFDPNKCSLSNVNTQDEINLPATAGCILAVLLESNGGAVDRNSIIDSVLERFSFDLSNNTLNQYISLLRKSFKNIGVEENVILTILKVGFYISENITISKQSYDDSHLQEDVVEKVERKRSIPLFRILISLVVVIVIIEIFAVAFKDTYSITDYPLVKSGKIDTCDLYLSENLNEIGLAKSQIEAAEISKKHLPCVPGANFIYDVNSMHYLLGEGQRYLSRCIKSSNDETYAICSEVLLYD